MEINRRNVTTALTLLSFAEVALIVFLARTLDVVLICLVFVTSDAIGFLILSTQWKGVRLAWTKIEQLNQLEQEEKEVQYKNPELQAQIRDLFKFFASVALLLIPGLITDLVAFYLIYSLIRKGSSLSIAGAED